MKILYCIDLEDVLCTKQDEILAKLNITDIDFDLDVECYGTYSQGYAQTLMEPGEPCKIEDLCVFYRDIDLTEFLKASVIEEIIEQLFEEYFDWE